VKSILGFVKYYKMAMQQSQRELSNSLLQQSRLTGFYNQISQKLSLLSQNVPDTTNVVDKITDSGADLFHFNFVSEVFFGSNIHANSDWQIKTGTR